MYTVPKSVGCSTVHQTYVVFFINKLILIQDADLNSNKKKKKSLKQKKKSLQPNK